MAKAKRTLSDVIADREKLDTEYQKRSDELTAEFESLINQVDQPDSELQVKNREYAAGLRAQTQKSIAHLAVLRSADRVEKASLEDKLIALLQEGKNLPTDLFDKDLINAKTRLRRNGLIVNVGTRKRPIWKLKVSND
jgi:hypothetical protein